MKKTMILAFALFCGFFLLAQPGQSATLDGENQTLYRLHLGMGAGDSPVSDAEIQEFIDTEITPRFPRGLTITAARGQWKAPETALLRERTTVVDVQDSPGPETEAKIDELGRIYVERFRRARASLFYVRIDGAFTRLYY